MSKSRVQLSLARYRLDDSVAHLVVCTLEWRKDQELEPVLRPAALPARASLCGVEVGFPRRLLDPPTEICETCAEIALDAEWRGLPRRNAMSETISATLKYGEPLMTCACGAAWYLFVFIPRAEPSRLYCQCGRVHDYENGQLTVIDEG